MAALVDFDTFFLTFPPLKKEADFDRFWKDAQAASKKIPADPEIKVNHSKSSARFEVSDFSFSSIGRVKIHGLFYLPRHTEKPRPVIIVHDYNSPEPYKGFGLDEHFCYLFIRLRGHEMISHSVHEKEEFTKGTARASSRKNERDLPGFFTDGISDPSDYYVKGVYCDLLRSIDSLRLNRKIDCSAMAVMGKGIGAAAALFCASVCDRITALVLDSPAFVHLDEWNNSSEGDIAAEIADYLKEHSSARQNIKRTLSYFDALNFSEDVSCDVLMAVGLRDSISPARCSLALFNHLLCDKTIEVYPEEGNEAGGEKQFRKSLAWIRERLLD